MARKQKAWTTMSIRRADVKSALDDARYAKRRVAEARDRLTAPVDSRIDDILKLVYSAGFACGKPYLHCSSWSGETHLALTISIENLRAPSFVGLLAAIDEIAPATKTEDSAGEYFASREFIFTQDKLRVQIIADLPTNGDACRRVLAGTELKEVAKYAIVCD